MREAWLRSLQLRQLFHLEVAHNAKPQDLHRQLTQALEIPTDAPSPFAQLKARAAAQRAANPKLQTSKTQKSPR